MRHEGSVVAAGLLTLAVAGTAAAWGATVHEMIGRVAPEGEGQRCLYNVWSKLGRGHLEELLGALRFVWPLIEPED